MIVNINSTIHIPDVPEQVMGLVNSDLTLENPKFLEAIAAGRSTRGLLPVIKNFTIDGSGGLHVPRGYSEQLFTTLHYLGIQPQIVDQRSVVPFDRSYSHTIVPRVYQYPALQGMSKFAEGLLVAPAGSGKTVMGVALSLMCGQKYLWVTHTKQLLGQFVDRVRDMVDVTDDDIGLIYKGNWDTGKPITVGLVQTLVRDLEQLITLKDTFGTVIVDEVHHVAAATFTEVVASLNPFYLYGLTATPYRRDGLHSMMFHNIGPARHTIPRSEVADGIITPRVLPRTVNNAPMADSYQKLLIELTNDTKRNFQIAQDVIAEAKKGNICIVSTERVAHTKKLYDIIKAAWPKTGVVTGKNVDKDRDKVLEALNGGEITVLVCTSHLLGEGFDFAPLNRLFICLPFRNKARCEQLVGRVQRISDSKVDAIIFDYIDNHGLARHQYQNKTGKDCRYNVYKALGCEVG